MARPQLHPRTNTYWLRKRVPADLVDAVGKKEEYYSLQTRDGEEAKRRYAVEVLKLEQRWASLRGGARSLTEEEAHALARSAHDGWINKHRAEPSQQIEWPVEIGPKVFGSPSPIDLSKYGSADFWRLDSDLAKVMKLEAWCQGFAEHILKEHGLSVDEASRHKLSKAVAIGVQRASETLARMARGEPAPDGVPVVAASSAPVVPFVSPAAPAIASTNHVTSRNARVTLSGIVEAWWAEAEKANRTSSTRESYTNTVRNLVAFLKHDDATRVTPENVIAFKDHRLNTRKRNGQLVSPRTVKNSDIAGLKTVFGFAVANRLLPINPTLGVKVQTAPRVREREGEFTKQEAGRILLAANNHVRGKEREQTHAAKRWIPWLMAFSGGRVGEFVQMRKQDVRLFEVEGHSAGVWVMTITPEAGTVKGKKVRQIPVHPQLVEMGFIRFVQAAKEDRLFLKLSETGDIEGLRQGVKNRLAEFARKQVPDAGVAPNHGWRHRFRSEAVSAGVEDSVIDAIGGWEAPSVGRRYGNPPLKARADAIFRLPWIKID